MVTGKGEEAAPPKKRRVRVKKDGPMFTNIQYQPVSRLSSSDRKHLLKLICTKTGLPIAAASSLLSRYQSFATVYRYLEPTRILYASKIGYKIMSEADHLFHLWLVPTSYENIVDQAILEFEKEREFTGAERKIVMEFILRERTNLKRSKIRSIVEKNWYYDEDPMKLLTKHKIKKAAFVI